MTEHNNTERLISEIQEFNKQRENNPLNIDGNLEDLIREEQVVGENRKTTKEMMQEA